MGDTLIKNLPSRVALGLCLLLVCGAGLAQKAIPVPRLDAPQYLGAWHVQAWIPNKAEKRCVANVTVLYAVGDGSNAFQMGTFCQRANGSTDEWSGSGKLDKAGTGKLKLRRWVLLSSPYWVLANAPDYQWALVGTPNHKRLWVLSKAPEIAPETMAEIQAKATAQGFDATKLVKTVQTARAL